MQRTMQDLSEGVFIIMANLTLARRDSYLEFIRGGVKRDTLTALRTSPVHLHSLFPDSLLVKAEYEERRSSGSAHRKPGRFHPYASSSSRSTHQPDRKPTHRPGSKLETGKWDRKVVAKPQTSAKSRPRVQRKVNDNYCVLNVAGVKDSVHVSGKNQDLNPSPVTSKSENVFLHVNSCCKCSFCHWDATKERRKAQLLLPLYRNKAGERCFMCRSLEFCKYCHKCPNCCHKSTCRGKVTAIWGEVGSSGFESKSSHNTERGLHPPLPVQTQPNQVTNGQKQLCQPTKTVPPSGSTVSADKQKCSGTGSKPKLTGFLQPAIFGTQTQQPVETYPGPEHLEHLPKYRVVQNGDPRDNKDFPTTRGVGHLHRIQGCILPYTNSQSVQEAHAF